MDVEVVARALSTLPSDDDHPYRTGPWRPQRTEWRADDCDVVGEIPADLDGVYIRNTENPVHPALAPYHPFDGDGMLHLVGFRDGKAFYRNRFVRTDAFLAEQEAGRALWAPLTAPAGSGERSDGTGIRGYLKDASSTDVVVHNGVIKSSHFECGDLWRVDPFTLDTLGKSAWGGRFPAEGVSAHPKLDEASGELLFFNYSLAAPYMHYGVLDPTDHLVHYIDVPLPGPRLPHDMTFTANYAIVNDLPMVWDEALAAKGVYLPRFRREMPTRLGVIPRRGRTEDIRWFSFDPTYVLHWTNAWEEGDEIVVEGFFQHDPMPSVDRSAGFSERMSRFISLDGFQSRLHRWRMNLATGATSEESLTDTISEFGMINARSAGRQHRYTYAALGEPGKFLFNGLVRHDTRTGAEDALRFPPGVFGSEAAVAPKTGAGPAGDEDDAYLVTLTIDVAEDRSECWVLDAARPSDGPIARIRLPERISSGTHSTWAPGSAIPGWQDADAWQARARL
jgi:carotenoid cleavage dioxygenase-like enzyme